MIDQSVFRMMKETSAIMKEASATFDYIRATAPMMAEQAERLAKGAETAKAIEKIAEDRTEIIESVPSEKQEPTS
jgi:methyl-accepting chemotaxis protein